MFSEQLKKIPEAPPIAKAERNVLTRGRANHLQVTAVT